MPEGANAAVATRYTAAALRDDAASCADPGHRCRRSAYNDNNSMRVAKMMKTIPWLVAALTLGITAVSAENISQNWLASRIGEAKSVKPGMTETLFLNIFQIDVGKQARTPDRFSLKSCRLIKVRANFGAPKNMSKAAASVLINSSRPFLDHAQGLQSLSHDEQSLLPLLQDAYEIKPGTKRIDLLKNFEPEAGLQSMLPTRYIHKNCPMAKLDVTFENGSDAGSSPGASDKDLSVKSVSELYVDLAIVD